MEQKMVVIDNYVTLGSGLSTAIKKILIPSDNCDDTGTILYNLDAIIAVGYRVNSYEATQFRIWARGVLKEYIIKGFVMDDERLKGKNPFGADYFEELLERIREIRTSGRRYYQKITDIYAECSSDYDPKSEITLTFYKTVQNMMHYAVTHQTAAEIVYDRADAEKPHMGLMTWKNAPDGRVVKSDVTLRNGDELKGTLDGSEKKVKISIAAGATVTLHNATIDGKAENGTDTPWAGITCEGDATIILSGENTVTNFNSYYPAIFVPAGHTLTMYHRGQDIL